MVGTVSGVDQLWIYRVGTQAWELGASSKQSCWASEIGHQGGQQDSSMGKDDCCTSLIV